MAYAQPRLGAYNTTQFRFSQQLSQPIVISSLPRTSLNVYVQDKVTSQKSVPNSVTRTAETKRFADDKEVIVLSSDSESDTETRRPVVSKKKENGSYVNKEIRKKNLELTTVDQHPTLSSDLNRSSIVNEDNRQRKDINSLSNETTKSKSTHESINKKNLLDDYKLVQSNKEKSSLSQIVNPVRVFLNILEDHKTNIEFFEIIVDFARIYLEIYNEDKRIITKTNDFQTLVVDLIYCLMSRMKDDHYMATSERFKQVELLAQKAIEVIDRLKETGEKIKRIEYYKKTQHNEKKRNGEVGNSQESKRRKLSDDREYKRHNEQKRWEQLESYEEKRLHDELEKELGRKDLQELEKQTKSQVNKIQPSKRLDYPSIPAPLQFNNIRPRKTTDREAEFVNLLAKPLHELITTQLVYDLYKNFTPKYLSQTVNKCTVDRIFRLNNSERDEYCKQLYRQYVNTSMKSTTSVLESWIKTRISETARPYLSSKKR
ncbi:hypothetical protein RclHR1_02470019 [Rhizophagus clarus]|uniref:Uncharacterized protein n=1 Tax=Rhizophagus clarus TaxID=94130 RepID=A0A2Z6QZJ7_9GLOM|nr:hypothetical protein RclHR1_02470019 [Rhizophagus clarus]GES75506.1 hypothetical protein GLOIN_2v160206 [Rhizophagus clarus]